MKRLPEDSAVKKLNNGNVLVSNVDIFTPIHDDPEIMGMITACNVTNDIFAMNILNVVCYLSFLGIPPDQPDEISEGLLTGQRKFLSNFGADIDGGHTVLNPWPLMGGLVTGIGKEEDLIGKQVEPDLRRGALIITKPLGIQPVMAAYRILKDSPKLLADFDEKEIREAIKLAETLMTLSNYYAVRAINESGLKSYISAMTDVTGFGLKTHTAEMIIQRKLDAVINTIPVIKTAPALAELLCYDLEGGNAAETAGPLLMVIDEDKVDPEEVVRIFKNYGVNSWIIGTVTEGSSRVIIDENVKIIEIKQYQSP